jgi:hypothetical protein
MPADACENPGDCKQVEHLLSVFGTSRLPTIDTGVNTFLQCLKFIDIKPGNVVSLPSGFLRISQIEKAEILEILNIPWCCS